MFRKIFPLVLLMVASCSTTADTSTPTPPPIEPSEPTPPTPPAPPISAVNPAELRSEDKALFLSMWNLNDPNSNIPLTSMHSDIVSVTIHTEHRIVLYHADSEFFEVPDFEIPNVPECMKGFGTNMAPNGRSMMMEAVTAAEVPFKDAQPDHYLKYSFHSGHVYFYPVRRDGCSAYQLRAFNPKTGSDLPFVALFNADLKKHEKYHHVPPSLRNVFAYTVAFKTAGVIPRSFVLFRSDDIL